MAATEFSPCAAGGELLAGEEDIDAASLYAQIVVDTARLAGHIRQSLQTRAQVTLRELVAEHPLEHGLAELVAYLQLGSGSFSAVVDEEVRESIEWDAVDGDGIAVHKTARVPRQAGKTTLVRQIAERQKMRYLTLDDELTRLSARDDPVGMIRGLDRAVIDEIQRAPQLLLAIKKSIDEDR